jgi:hypothetical protein
LSIYLREWFCGTTNQRGEAFLLTVPIKQNVTKHGHTVLVPIFRLTDSGEMQEDARMKLEQGIRAWCQSLEKIGLLTVAIQRAGLHVEPTGAEGFQVVI